MTNEIKFSKESADVEKEPLLRWFDGAHLPEPLQTMMYQYRAMAEYVVSALPPSAERTIALRELITSKDNAIRGLVDLQRQNQ